MEKKYLKANISYDGVTRVETYPYPPEALREAIYNAIAHKNYATLIPIQISVYIDKIYIGNECVFPEDWTIENLLGKHNSRPYNPLIANTFFRAGYIESWGRGIQKIRESCERNGNKMAEYSVSPSEITVMFQSLEFTNKDAPQDAPQDELDEIEKSILIYCKIARSKREIAEHLGYSDVKGFAARHLKPLLEKKLLKMTIPDKPKSKKQKYINNCKL